MTIRLKPLFQQVIVITGASSGIGLVTARAAAGRGAAVVLVARQRSAIDEAAEDIRRCGGRAASFAADVADAEAVRGAARQALERFGALDTWVNNAGVSSYGRLDQTPPEEHRRIFETNYWGVVNGSMTALEHLRENGGAIINIGSVLSDLALPLQAPYVASKHAVQGFTNALRQEVQDAALAISITLIKPGTIDTPLSEHAASHLSAEPRNPPPVYAPDIVADAILYAAEHPSRELVVGGGGRFLIGMYRLAPGLSDRLMSRVARWYQHSQEAPISDQHRGPFEPSGNLRVRSHIDYRVRETSLYTWAITHPVAAVSAAAAAGGVGLLLWARARRSNG